jgi:hypothetical protein
MRLSAFRDRLPWSHARAAVRVAPAWQETAVAAEPAMAAAFSPEPLSRWSPGRLKIVEELWGEGFLWPGGAEEVLRLAVPLGLSAASSLLLLGVGGGGPAMRLAGELGVWVCGCESDPELVALAAKRLHRAGKPLSKRAVIQAWNPQNPSFRSSAYQHAVAVEALSGSSVPKVLAALAKAIRPGGQVALLDTVADEPLDPGDPEVAAWQRLEQRSLPLPTPNDVSLGLHGLGFEVRVVEDVSARHIRAAIAGWKRLLYTMDTGKPDPQRAALMVQEAELWLRRIRLMRQGRLRVIRWLALDRAVERGPAH